MRRNVMDSPRIRSILLLLAFSASLAFSRERAAGDYSVLGGFLGSLGGIAIGGIAGGFVASPSADRCQEGANSDVKGLCSLGVLYGMGIGASIGYSLGIPVGGHLRGGLLNRKFAVNMAAITLLTGALALVDYGLYEAYDEKSFRITVPLSLLAPPLTAYWIGR